MSERGYSVSKVRTVYQTRDRKYDNMKYLRTVKNYVRSRYSLSDSDIDMMLFLFTEPPFTRKHFDTFEEIYPWDKDRFNKLLREGWIRIWRRRGKEAQLYDLSNKGKELIKNFYMWCAGEQPISEKPSKNPVMRRERFIDKVTARFIKVMNRRNGY